MGDTARRMFDLIMILQSEDGVSGAELADRLGTTTRTVRSDIGRLRGLGFRFRTRPGPSEGYRMVPGERIPPMALGDHEAVAMAVGLTIVAGTRDPASPLADGAFDGAACSALEKVDRFLPERLRHRTEAEAARVIPYIQPPPHVDKELLEVLTEAVATRSGVRWRYTEHLDRHRTEYFEPYRVVFRYPHWYVIGHYGQRGGWRMRRLDGIHGARRSRGPRWGTTGMPPSVRERFHDHVRESWHDGSLLVDARRDGLEEALRFHTYEVEALGHDRYRVRMQAADWGALVMRLALQGIGFRVEWPSRLAQLCADLARRLADVGTGTGRVCTGECGPGGQ